MTLSAKIQETWALFSSDQQLSDVEHAQLRQALTEDSAAGDVLAGDQRLHRMLSTMAHIDETRELFVDNVVMQCEEQHTSAESPLSTMAESVAEADVFICTEPPLTSPQAIRSSTTPSRRRISERSAVWTHPVVLTLCLSTLVTGITLLFTLDRLSDVSSRLSELKGQLREAQPRNHRRPTTVATDQGFPLAPPREAGADPDADLPLSTAGALPVATITRSNGTRWSIDPGGNALMKGPLTHRSGLTELTMSGGATIELEGPALLELLSPSHISLISGTLHVVVPVKDTEFRVSTPNARIVEPGTEFHVTVDDSGETDVQHDNGEVVVIPDPGSPNAKRWRLTGSDFDHAVVCSADGPGSEIAASRITGPAGFQGQIQLAGESVLLDDANRFDQLHNGIMKRFTASREQAIQDWLKLAQSFNNATATMNGQNIPIEFPAFEDARDGVQQNSVFVGRININGEEHTFNSQKEFDEFRQRMMLPFQPPGRNRPDETQFELDLKKNPFQP